MSPAGGSDDAAAATTGRGQAPEAAEAPTAASSPCASSLGSGFLLPPVNAAQLKVSAKVVVHTPGRAWRVAAGAKDVSEQSRQVPGGSMLVDPAVLQQMLGFFVHVALEAGRGWGAPMAVTDQVGC